LAELAIAWIFFNFAQKHGQNLLFELFVRQWHEVTQKGKSFFIDQFGLFCELDIIDNAKAAVEQKILHLTEIGAVLPQSIHQLAYWNLL
jgi:hypothetical protein